jgi:hypothetical protein
VCGEAFQKVARLRKEKICLPKSVSLYALDREVPTSVSAEVCRSILSIGMLIRVGSRISFASVLKYLSHVDTLAYNFLVYERGGDGTVSSYFLNGCWYILDTHR